MAYAAVRDMERGSTVSGLAALHEDGLKEDDTFAEVRVVCMERQSIMSQSTSSAGSDSDGNDDDEASSVGTPCRPRIERFETDYSPSYMHRDYQLGFFPSPNTSDSDGDDDDEASSVGTPCRPRIERFETDYSPSYMHRDYQLAFFPAPPVATHSPMVASSTIFAPIPCDVQVKMPASVYAFSIHTPLQTTAVTCTDAPDRTVAVSQDLPEDVADVGNTSVLLRNLPDGFTRTMLMDVLRAQGLARHVDFVYVPADLQTMATYGFAFLNLSTPEIAKECMAKLGGFSAWGMPSASACEASWCTAQQGLQAHIERYRNSRMMHETVDDEYKPAVFKNGSRICFPSPTKPIRAPRPAKPIGASRLRKGEDFA